MKGQGAIFILFIVGLVALIIGLSTSFPRCGKCGSVISGDRYKAYGSTYCSACAHRLYPFATWK